MVFTSIFQARQPTGPIFFFVSTVTVETDIMVGKLTSDICWSKREHIIKPKNQCPFFLRKKLLTFEAPPSQPQPASTSSSVTPVRTRTDELALLHAGDSAIVRSINYLFITTHYEAAATTKVQHFHVQR